MEAFSYLQKINPKLTGEEIVAAHVARLRYAQPVCEPGFAAKIPPVVTPIKGLQIADTCFYYPEDRGISESVRLGREMAARFLSRREKRPAAAARLDFNFVRRTSDSLRMSGASNIPQRIYCQQTGVSEDEDETTPVRVDRRFQRSASAV